MVCGGNRGEYGLLPENSAAGEWCLMPGFSCVFLSLVTAVVAGGATVVRLRLRQRPLRPSATLRPVMLGVSALCAGLAPGGIELAGGNERVEFFEQKIRPLLERHCSACHSSDTRQSGGLVLDSKHGWTNGGDSGPAILPGDPAGSLLIRAVQWNNEALKMPPEDAGGKLTDAQIRDLEVWIRQGAFDPRTEPRGTGITRSWEETFAGRRDWWSLQPVRNPEIPETDDPDWSQHAVDRFLRVKMASEGIVPSPPAPPETLLRRAALVLTGLPTAGDDAAEFSAAARSDPEAAYVALIDRLLESPQYAERLTRHWLDVVRYGDTHGNEWNYDVPFAWRYRDYVIRAFSQDLPYDQFVREHIAGDLLPSPRWHPQQKFNESVIGTAFYRFGEVSHDSCVDFSIIGYDIIDNQLDTLTKAFQSTTVACARCHDHKLDAVSTRDYHALLGILRSSRPVQHTLDGPEANRHAMARLTDLKKEIRAELCRGWIQAVSTLDAAALNRLVDADSGQPPRSHPESPLHAWAATVHAGASTAQAGASAVPVTDRWTSSAAAHAQELARRSEFNQTRFSLVADLRGGLPDGWSADGMGLRQRTDPGDFVVSAEGDATIRMFLPSGIFTFAISDKLNGALRSPTLVRKAGRISFEVIGGHSSLARLVFNNCQFNYTHQQSLHYDDWTWVTINFQENTDSLHPYAELLTAWDNPKFPDPLGTLGKDTENQRGPWAEHMKNPRTWWGVRRVVAHDGTETPLAELTHLNRLYDGGLPQTAEDFAARYRRIATDVIQAFAEQRASDDDIHWLDWLRKAGLISDNLQASPRLAELVRQYRETEQVEIAVPTMIPGMADEGPGFPQPVLLRGEPGKPGDIVERRYLEALAPVAPDDSPVGSGRLLVAERIADSSNPLTARVMVNRLWQWVFGQGLVRTPDDFGHLGDMPNHPELLDHLASRFVADGWSTKRLVRALVLSRAFRSSGSPTTAARERDPQNLLLSYYPVRRAEAEVIRDSLLAVSGRLDPTLYGPSIHPYREQADPDKRLFTGPLDGDGRRSLYIKFQLMEAPHFLRAFNLPDAKVTQGRRDVSNAPAQSLAMLNDPFVLAMAEFWAGRLVADGCSDVSDRVSGMYQSALGRPASDSERVRLVGAIDSFAAEQDVSPAGLMASQSVWREAAHALFNFQEFIFIP